MILGIGVDIVEVERIRSAMSKKGFINRVFTSNEVKYCEEKKTQKFQSYAARFAAREAFLKAIGTGFKEGFFKDISVENDQFGKPYIVLQGYYLNLAKEKNVKNVHITLSHTKNIAIAYVVLEDDE